VVQLSARGIRAIGYANAKEMPERHTSPPAPYGSHTDTPPMTMIAEDRIVVRSYAACPMIHGSREGSLSPSTMADSGQAVTFPLGDQARIGDPGQHMGTASARPRWWCRWPGRALSCPHRGGEIADGLD